MQPELMRQLLFLERRDQETRARLVADGSLFDDYAPAMERVHLENASELEAILDIEGGWPTRSKVGLDGCRAAWVVAQHAISRPAFQHRCLALLREAVGHGDAPAVHAAYLEDRIRFNEGRPQVYGTCLDRDEGGRLSPGQLEDPERVDQRRREVGLPPLAEGLRRAEAQALREEAGPPGDFGRRRRAQEEWARRVGWRSGSQP
jgi:hypothetical protein